MSEQTSRYATTLRFRWLTPLYDAVVTLFGTMVLYRAVKPKRRLDRAQPP